MKSNETGAENALRFCAEVRFQATEHRIVIVWETKWPWMKNAEWRGVVTQTLLDNDTSLKDIRWQGPDQLDSAWVFSAYSTVTSHRIEQLSLDESLEDGLDLSARSIQFVKDRKTFCWWCFIVLGLVVATALGTCQQVTKSDNPPTIGRI